MVPATLSSLAKGIASTFVTNIGLALLGLGTGILAARLLGPGGRGELAAIQLLGTLLGSLAVLGLAESLAYHSAKDSARASNYIGSSIAISTVSAICFIAIGFVVMPLVLSNYSEGVILAARVYLLYILYSALVALPQNALRGTGRYIAWNTLRLLPVIMWFSIFVGSWLLGVVDAVQVAFAYLAALGLLLFPCSASIKKLIPGSYAPRANVSAALLRFGGVAMAASLPQLLRSRVDQIAIAAMLSPESLGLYVVAVGWAGIGSPLIGALTAVVLPSVASRTTEDERRRVFAKAARLSCLIAIVIASIAAALTPFLLTTLFGDSFQEAVRPSLVLIAAAVFTALNGVMQDGCNGLGQPILVLRAELIAAAVAVPTVIVLVQQYGLIGSAVASLVAALTVTIVLLFQTKFALRIDFRRMLVPSIGELRHLAATTLSGFRRSL